MEQEKSMFSYDKKNRIIETRYATYSIMTEYGWQQFQVPFKAITGWNMPVVREEKI